MLENRVIPCLQLLGTNLVKIVKFGKYGYIGDPMNTCRIFNELEVDEMVLLDIRATVSHKTPDFKLLERLASECFMPLAYGGGIRSADDARRLFCIGFEKVIINSALFDNIELVSQIAEIYGAQSIIASVDVRKDLFGKYKVYSNSGQKKEKVELFDWLQCLESAGVGEILLTNILTEGTWKGFDLELVKSVSERLSVPLVVHGGAGRKEDVENAVNIGGASAVGLGNMVVYQQKDMGVLVNYHHNYSFQHK